MHRSIRRVWLLMVAMLLVVGVVAVMPLTGAAGPRNNSANAKLCQKGGWQGLQGSAGPFASEEECVSFGAKGGTIIPIPTPTPPTLPASPSISLTFPATANVGVCRLTIHLADFTPSTEYTAEVWLGGADAPFHRNNFTITTNDQGDAVFNDTTYTLTDGLNVVQVRIADNGTLIATAWTVADC